MAEIGLILSVHFGLKLFQSIRKFFTDTLELDKYNFYVKSNLHSAFLPYIELVL